MRVQPPGGFNGALHPRVHGKFAAKGTGTTTSSGTTRQGTTRRGTASRRSGGVPPNGLGYSTKQWAQLRQLAAMARAGKHLDAHQLHLLAQAHKRRLNVLAGKSAVAKPKRKAAAKPRRATAKRTTTRKATTRTAASRTTARKPMPVRRTIAVR